MMARERQKRNALRGWLKAVVLVVAILGIQIAVSYAQSTSPRHMPEGMPCDDALRAEIIDSITTALNDYYVFPDVAREMEKHVRRNQKQGRYKQFNTVADFARALTTDLREVCHDRHLGVRYFSPEDLARIPLGEPTPDEVAQQRERMRQRFAKQNFLFKKIEILDGNVGYLKFNQFVDASMAGETAVAAMGFLAHCDALIIDLRENGGGSPTLIQFITSYFFDEPVHLNSFYIRKTDSIKQFWTSASVQGPRLSDVPLFVLTSGYTFSGAEEFSYNLKNLKRATIVGETTGGGAHPVEEHYFANVYAGIRIPYGRAINPITGTNWEGTGVTPDIAVPAADALDRAYLEALRYLKQKAGNPEEVARMDWVITGLEAKQNPVKVTPEQLAAYAGTYEDRRLWIEDGDLWYQRGDRPKARAIALTETLFRFDGLEYFRLEVVMDQSGNPVKLVGHYDNGMIDESVRTSDN